MINAIAIDDEPIALDIIRMQAAKVPFMKLKQTFSSAAKALDFLKTTTIDLIFLDITMPGIGGLDFVTMIDPAIQVIFTTAHSTYAIPGFDMAITDFLLKPFNYPRFLQACTMAQNRQGSTHRIEDDRNTLFVKDGYNWVKINFEELLYIKAEDNYISLVMQNRHILTRMTLQEVLSKLPTNLFIKVHKSYIINFSRLEQLEKNQLFIGGIKIPISRSFMEELKRSLQL